MTSAKKVKANRINAKASTGPRTVRGKARAAQNARQHGLGVSVCAGFAQSARIDSLTRIILGKKTTPVLNMLARRISEAQIDLVRIRQARHDTLANEARDDFPIRRKIVLASVKFAIEFARLHGPTFPMPRKACIAFDRIPGDAEKFAAATSRIADKLSVMNRYERRALSRRKFAIRAFTEATRADHGSKHQ